MRPTSRCRRSRRSRPRGTQRAKRILGPFAVILIFAVKWVAKLKILLVALPKIGFLKIAFVGAAQPRYLRAVLGLADRGAA